MVNVANQCLGAVWCAAPGTPIGGFVAAASGTPGGRAPAPEDCGLYTFDESGIAIVSCEGFFLKWSTPPYAISATRIRRAIWAARLDERVRGIMLAIDSPGGVVAGAVALADEIRAAVKFGPKPVHAFVEAGDVAAGSAYLAVSGAGRISAGPTARVGGLGLATVVHDSSGAYEKAGIKVHVIGTGEYKGAGTDGAPVREKDLGYFRELTADIGNRIFATLAKGRLLTEKQRASVRSGRVWEASRAKALGLIDEVASFDSAIRRLRLEAAEFSI